jgi:uncharacterized protein
MIILGYFFAMIMGVTLGLMGAGGSILTLPILVYLFRIDPVTASGYSLLIVGSTALFGAYRYHLKNLIDYRVTILFSLPAILAVYLTRIILVPAIPDEIEIFNFLIITKNSFIMILFASLMIASAYMMIRNRKDFKPAVEANSTKLIILIVLEGLLVGIITGIVGAGGGFLIIPALVLLAGLEMKAAVGSSLLIIAMKSLIGFLGDIQNGIIIDYQLIALFLICSIIGMIIGTKISNYFSSQKLKKFFGYFTLILSTIIITMEL